MVSQIRKGGVDLPQVRPLGPERASGGKAATGGVRRRRATMSSMARVFMRCREMSVAALAALLAAALPVAAQPIEDELVLITPVGKSFSDPALAEFRKYAKQRWNVDVKIERARRRHADRLRAHRRMERPAAGRPLLGRRERALRPARGAEPARAARPAEGGHRRHSGSRSARRRPSASRTRRASGWERCSRSCGIAYHPRLLERLGVPPPKDWDDLLDPRLKGQVGPGAAHALLEQPRRL